MDREFDFCQRAERSITKKYRKEIWNPFVEAVKKYELIEAGDKIAACISGGKDSMLMAKLLQMLQRFSDVPFGLEFLVMDPGYSAENRAKIEHNAASLGLPVKIFTSDIFEIANAADGAPCYLCARMRRGHLYAEAKKLGCNKIALGHHFSDVIETTVMAMFYGSQIQAMMPKLHSQNFKGMELIRPLYCVNEDDVIAWARYNGLDFIRCACKFTEFAADHENASKRKEIKDLIKELKKTNPNIEKCIFSAIHNVCVDTFPSYKTGGQLHSFLENYKDTTDENKDRRTVQVAAALIRDGERFLICRRPPEKTRGLLWEFVGGKREPGETLDQTLIRECREELGVTVAVGSVFARLTHEYPDLTVDLTVFNAAIAEGVPQLLEHSEIKWITKEQIPEYEFCPADEQILEMIKKS